MNAAGEGLMQPTVGYYFIAPWSRKSLRLHKLYRLFLIQKSF